jgi:Flp pilus assembly protein CpaB
LTQTDGKSQAVVVPVVTLLVNPADAESLTLANGEGRIQLVLRNSADRQVAPTRGRQLREIFASPAAAAPQEEPAPRPRKEVVRARPPEPPAVVPAVEVHPPPRPEVDELIIMNGKLRTREVFPRGGDQ